MGMIFLSYARTDAFGFVKRLKTDLVANGFKVWLDETSLPSRGVSLVQEVRDAINDAERFVAVLTPGAINSDYVQSEWAHAELFSRAITPVLLEGDWADWTSATRAPHGVDFSPGNSYTEAIENLVRLLADPVPRLAPFLAPVPGLPAHFQARSIEMAKLVDYVLPDIRGPQVVNEPVTILHGMGGAGKSVLATAFARSAETRRACADGIIWLRLGTEPDISHLLKRLSNVLGIVAEDTGLEEKLHHHFEGKRYLVVLDDAWEMEQIQPFCRILGPQSRLLITARQSVLPGVNQVPVSERLDDDSASKLIAGYNHSLVEELPDEATKVISECGQHPFALALSGSLAEDGVPWRDILDALLESDHGFLQQKLPEYTEYQTVMQCLKASVNILERRDPVAAQRYSELAVFAKGEEIAQETIETYWAHTGSMVGRDSRKLIAQLQKRSLLQVNYNGAGKYVTLHFL